MNIRIKRCLSSWAILTFGLITLLFMPEGVDCAKATGDRYLDQGTLSRNDILIDNRNVIEIKFEWLDTSLRISWANPAENYDEMVIFFDYVERNKLHGFLPPGAEGFTVPIDHAQEVISNLVDSYEYWRKLTRSHTQKNKEYQSEDSDNTFASQMRALSEDTALGFKFERMWPTLQQPWYFFKPYGTAIDYNGYVYVADSWHERILKFTADGQFVSQLKDFSSPYDIAVDKDGNLYVLDVFYVKKFTSDGRFVTEWGSSGSGDGEFSLPSGIAVDSKGFVYVTDTGNNRIQKFSSDGQFVTKWGNYGSGDGEFDTLRDIVVDSKGFVYVTDAKNYRIQKFSSDGQFVTKWGREAIEWQPGEAEFKYPYGIAVDSSGYVYVVDWSTYLVQKFTSDGQFVMRWGGFGHGDGNLFLPQGIAVDRNDGVYVVDTGNDRVQKFTSVGQFLFRWGPHGSRNGEFTKLGHIAVDRDNFVYVTDDYNNRVQKFTLDGRFVTKWGVFGSGDGEFGTPKGIAIDSSGYVYVVDWYFELVQKFTADGQFITKWGSYGYGDGEFIDPAGIAADNIGFVYVTEMENNRIQKFTSDGQFVTKWGNYGSGDGEFESPEGITVDKDGFIYVVDRLNRRIQKFTSDGQFVTKWGKAGSGDGEFSIPTGIAVDDMGFVYVADRHNDRIQKFTSDGQFITKWGFQGHEPGMFSWPQSVALDSNGRIFIADYGNSRVQVFKPVTVSSNNKAIVVAGGGPYSGNNLWDATQMCANFAYRTLTYQGFTKETIYYLTSDLDLDLDSNGKLDDVDGDAINNNLQHAITKWSADADSLILYFVDHGGNSTFRMSGTETLSASEVDSWLDPLQETINGKVIVIYDACDSGSFLSALKPPTGKERVVITSTSPGESAYFVSQGTVSFSNYFWTHIFNGLDIKNAFDLAQDALQHTTIYQNPLLDANANGTANEVEDYNLVQNTYIGNGTVIHGDIPTIGNVSDPQIISGSTSALLFASNVTDNDGIARVWATIRPPDYAQESSDNPVQNLPTIDLKSVGMERYEVTYAGFNIPGTYQIAIYARDRIGNTSIPKLTTASVNNPLRRKAIIVAGGDQSDTLWSAIKTCAGFAYEALTFQGYTDDDIYFLSPVTFSTGVDGTPTISNLNYAITTWAHESTQDVILYLVGNGGHETFQINETESLLPSDLDEWLDSLQSAIPGKVTVIYDASQSGSFLSSLVPPSNKERILISSTDSEGPAYFPINGSISFSSFFWRQVLNGANVRDAFVYTINAVGYASKGQEPELDDSGNGLGNEQGVDGRLARDYTIGVGIMLAGDEPLIGSVSPAQVLNGESSATIWAEDVTTTGTIDKVYALITPPGDTTNPLEDMLTLELSFVENGRYEGTYCRFTSQGTYTISVYAMDNNGNVSLPKETQVEQTIASDVGYENYTYFPHIASDNTWETEICIINEGSQSLNGELRAYDNSGQLVDSKCISLTSKARREIIVGDEFSNPSNIGYIIFESDSQNLCGYTKFYIEGKYRVAIPSASDVNKGDVYISHIASDSNWTTGISILNTTSSTIDIFIDFDNGTTRAITIEANEHKAFTIRQLFDDEMQPNINSAVIKNGNGIMGLEIFGTTESSGLSFLSGILLKDDTTSTIYYPHIASDETWGTGIVAYNPSETSCELTITPYSVSGTPLSPQTLTLSGQEKYIGTVDGLDLPDGTAWFSIESTSPITGFELFSTKDGKQLGGYTGVGISGKDGVFAKIDKDGGTGIAFVNIEDSAATVTMTAYDDNGSVIATETVNLAAHQKKVDVPSNLFSTDISIATYINYSSSGSVVGFQLNVSSDGMMLDALPGM